MTPRSAPRPVLLVAAALLAAAAPAAVPDAQVPSWRHPAPVAAAAASAARACAACHGSAAPPQLVPVPKLARQRQSYVFRAMLAYRDGQRTDPQMAPLMQGLSDQQMRDLAAAVAGTMLDRPPPLRDDLPGFVQASRDCLWCHGETGIGEFEGMPVLAGQDAAYLASALAAYRAGTRTDPTMGAVAAELSDAEIGQLAQYYAGHQWLERGP